MIKIVLYVSTLLVNYYNLMIKCIVICHRGVISRFTDLSAEKNNINKLEIPI